MTIRKFSAIDGTTDIFHVGNFDFSWNDISEKKEKTTVSVRSTLSEEDVTVQDWKKQVAEADEANSQWKPSTQVKLVILLQCFIVFIVSIDMTILSTTLPNIGEALHLNATSCFWIATSYLLANAIIQPVVAALADIWGRKAVYFSAVLSFTLGTVVCCTSNGIPAMLAGRVLQGIGGGGIISTNLIILADLIPLRSRSQYQGYMQLVFSLGTNTAPIIGGGLIKVSWRAVFWINLPFCAVGLAAIPLMLKYQRTRTTTYDKLSQVDWVGSAMAIVSTTLLLVGLSWGGSQYPWSSAATLVPVIVGVLGVAATVIYEAFVPAKPFLQLALFKDVSSTFAYLCTTLQALLVSLTSESLHLDLTLTCFRMFCECYYLCLYLLSVKLMEPITAGCVLLAYGITVVPVSGVFGAVIAKTGRYRWVIWAGYVLSTLGAGLLMLLDVKSSLGEIIPVFIVAGMGQGLLFISLSTATQASCDSKDVAFAASMYGFFRSFGLCLGVALGGTIWQNFLEQRVLAMGLSPEIATNAEALAYIIRLLPANADRQAELEAFACAFKMLFATMTGISGVGMLMSLAIKENTLDKALESEHRLRVRSLSVA